MHVSLISVLIVLFPANLINFMTAKATTCRDANYKWRQWWVSRPNPASALSGHQQVPVCSIRMHYITNTKSTLSGADISSFLSVSLRRGLNHNDQLITKKNTQKQQQRVRCTQPLLKSRPTWGNLYLFSGKIIILINLLWDTRLIAFPSAWRAENKK